MLSHLSRVQLFATLWTVALQAPLSIGFSKQEYYSGFPFPPPEDLPDPGIKPASPASPALQADSLLPSPPRKLQYKLYKFSKNRTGLESYSNFFALVLRFSVYVGQVMSRH